MPSDESEAQAVRRQLERILESPGFARNERLSRFLGFVIERHLEGRDNELKESVIAVEVLGRKPDYDPRHDPIVRTEAGRLRTRLSEYYVGEGKDDKLVIELPKGGYTPLFREAEQAVSLARPSKSRRVWLLVAFAGLASALAGTAWWWVHPRSAPFTIAVLPLENLGHDPANDYFADGLTDELIRNLSGIEGLAVRSRTSSFALKAKSRNVSEAGKQLGAEYILEGSVLRSGQQLRINVQLIRAHDDFSLWSGNFYRELTDVLAIQDEIATGIANNLRLKLGRGRRRYEISTEAYDRYLRARAVATGQSIGLFQEAIANDPSFAPGYAGLAMAYAYRSGTVESDQSDLAKMRTAAEKALQLDPFLAEAHDALGMACARDANWRESEKSFRRAIELDPSRSMSYADFATNLLLVLGRIEEAVHELRIAEKADPLSSQVHAHLSRALMSAGRYDEAAGQCLRLPEDGMGWSECLGRARLGQGRISEAVQVLTSAVDRGVPADSPIRGYLGYAYGRAGLRKDAEELATAVAANPFQQALTFAGLSDKNRTLEALERMARFGPVRLGRDLTYPEFALIRGDPRVKALRKRVGLPE